MARKNKNDNTVMISGRITPGESAALRKFRFQNEIETGGETVAHAIRSFLKTEGIEVVEPDAPATDDAADSSTEDTAAGTPETSDEGDNPAKPAPARGSNKPS